MTATTNEKESSMPMAATTTTIDDASSTSLPADNGNSIKEVLQVLYDSDKYKDLTFVVAKNEIRANELLVKTRSSVLKEKIEDSKRAPNDKIILDDQSKKYNVPALSQKCLDIFDKHLNKNNVSIFAAAAFRNPNLSEIFQKCIDLDPNVMESMQFFYVDKYGKVEDILDASFIKQILEQPRDENAEDALFAKIYEWAKHDCRHRGLKEESNNIKETLKDLLPYIRFSNLKPYTLATIVRPNNLLSLEDLVSYFCTIALKDNQKDENANV
uniref:BACK domain-containing protein n=1 Tax=Panagrolaimus sp. ES5 TaxID=591445 RepID=A0AC34G4C6_9BILA